MAPEQAAARQVGPAADWYAVGVGYWIISRKSIPSGIWTSFGVWRSARSRPCAPRFLSEDSRGEIFVVGKGSDYAPLMSFSGCGAFAKLFFRLSESFRR